jgi:ribonuclease PH
MRSDGRTPGELRPVKITPGFIRQPEGSVLTGLQRDVQPGV